MQCKVLCFVQDQDFTAEPHNLEYFLATTAWYLCVLGPGMPYIISTLALTFNTSLVSSHDMTELILKTVKCLFIKSWLEQQIHH